MKWAIVLVFILGCRVTLPAQTNVIPLLHTLQGDFENANIIRTNPAYVVISHAAGLAKVAMTNLPSDIRKMVGYSPDQAHKAQIEDARLAAKQKEQKISDQKTLAANMAKTTKMQLLSLMDSYGHYLVKVGTTNLIVSIPVVPKNVVDSLTSYLTTEKNYQDQIIYTKSVQDYNAKKVLETGNSLGYDDTIKQQNAEMRMQTLREHLARLKPSLADATTFYAFPLGFLDNGIPRWQAVQ